VVLVLSYLMVSRVRFRSFKGLRFSFKTVGVVLLVAGACATWVMAGFAKAFIFLLLVLAYIVLGLAEEVLFYRRRRAQERKDRGIPLPEPPAIRDEEVLRELGAFDDEPHESEPSKEADPTEHGATPHPSR
jgi:CDP-diacylglycerol--serine O-phosphatidyltransferase